MNDVKVIGVRQVQIEQLNELRTCRGFGKVVKVDIQVDSMSQRVYNRKLQIPNAMLCLQCLSFRMIGCLFTLNRCQ